MEPEMSTESCNELRTQKKNEGVTITNTPKHNRPLWVAVQGLIRPTPYTLQIPQSHTAYWAGVVVIL
jgi:hypothetical protein